MREILSRLENNQDLTGEQMRSVMNAIMSGQAAAEDMESFLLLLRQKGASIDEITAAAQIMREYALKVPVRRDIVLDTCGTGGDRSGTFNISTISAVVVAATGVMVAKHGNRSVSSRCGSADILEALGVRLDLSVEQLSACLEEVGLAFLFAQRLHPAMRHVAPIRKKLGMETIFNVLGPLTNPASASHQMMGVYDPRLVEPMARTLQNLGSQHAIVVHGHDGLDEVSTTGPTIIAESDGKNVRTYEVVPAQFGLPQAELNDLKGGDLATNVIITREILEGKPGPKRDIVLLNAGFALRAADAVGSVEEGICRARDVIDSGQAAAKLEQLKKFSHECA